MTGTTFYGVCKGTTKAGTSCRHRSVYANGYCRQHGGDSTAYDKARFEYTKAKALARSRRFFARIKRYMSATEK